MDETPSRKHQVSLRGASAREISRDALLQKVSHERELRNYARRATASAIFIQRVWRRFIVTKKVAAELQLEWEAEAALVKNDLTVMSGSWISTRVLRPFLFFVHCLSTRHHKIRDADIPCLHTCFKLLLESINSTDLGNNFCALALGTPEERRTWTYQSQKLVSLCSIILANCDKSHQRAQDILVLTSLAMRLLVVLTDQKCWKSITNNSPKDADVAWKDLVRFMARPKSGLYLSIRRYISNLDIHFCPQTSTLAQTDDRFLITASAITLALRPFNVTNFDFIGPDVVDINSAPAQYYLFLLTIPWLTQRLPAVLLPALKHKSILSPCFQTLLILRDNILKEMSEMDQLKILHSSKAIPPVAWALANTICLVTGDENDYAEPGGLNQGLDYAVYVHVVIILAENLLSWLDDGGWTEKENQYAQVIAETSAEPFGKALCEIETTCALKMTYVSLLRPVCQQWHLTKLLAMSKMDANINGDETLPTKTLKYSGKLNLLGIAYFYSCMLRIFAILNPTVGSLPVLNMLSFTPGFPVTLWEALENLLFPGHGDISVVNDFHTRKVSANKNDGFLKKQQKQPSKDGGNKLVNVLHKLTGKSQAGVDHGDSVNGNPSAQVGDDLHDAWDVELLRCGPQKISREMSCLLHLFCGTYSHLLLVLDDIEFYEKQVPFMLEQQQRIASVLNTLAYNGLAHSISQQDRPLMDSAIRCLHLMYERDCRHQFCPPVLWLSPARKSRAPIAVAARTHEAMSANIKSDDALTVPSMGSVITVTPHVYPFEERVQMFREFINMDKVSRKMAGEFTGPGSRAVEIVVRRSHIVEDGFQQLNSLGSRLKSSIHVSFVSDCGLPEAGLDYGGLSKEFLTDISKSAFSPEHGLFSQTSTSERHLIPNPTAKYLENGIQMIEFLGRVVGKALYEGILLDYSFSHVFVQKLLGRYSFLDELSTLDPELYRNVLYVKHYDGDVKDLSLDFTVTEELFGKRHVIELKPGGKDVCVSNENKMQYVHAMADYKLNRQILPFSNAFYRGLADLISPSWLKLFNASEFNQLLSGGDLDIDVDDLRNYTRYTGGYSEGSRTIKLFWEVIKGFEPNERCMLLKFVTSCSRAPLLGFKHLQPSFTIHKVSCDASLWATIGGQDVERLPSASTCYNTLKLPTYKRASTLRAKILYAINSNTGFELS
ncbi:E3 ubiquitin-protein ligase UPL7 [Populus nigra]|uniref:E3 ubiquitin-protein ligase UPL7 n=1 Tax=Populus nigra TaxID=3691 RepID=UPI002B27768A|nr:E3 ubiquitin-protein ligase UPL7 [Populus nigra]